MKFRILSALLRSAWAIDERYAIAHGGIVAGLMNGFEMEASVDEESKEEKNSLPFAVCASAPGRKYSIFDEAPKGSIAVIPVRGPLMKDDENDCGVLQAGMATLGSRVKEADQHPNIIGSILYVDSPGGTVDGTQAFADAVKSAEKPIVTFIDGLMASAGLWVGTSADKVIAQNTTTEIGSIGVMIAFANMQPYWEAQGIEFHRINSDKSKDKNKTYYDALKGDYKAIKDEELNPLADQFIAAVKSNRGNLPESVFTGKVYFAEEALLLGLIDEIGSFDRAVELVSELAAEKDSQNAQPKSTKTKIIKHTMEVPVLIDLLQVAAIESTEEGVYLREEEIMSIENRLAADKVAIDGIPATVEAAVEAARTEADAARVIAEEALGISETARIAAEEARDQELASREVAVANLTAAVAELDEIHPEIAAAATVTEKVAAIRTILSRRPGVKPAGVKSEKDDNPSADGVDYEKLNSLPHMQETD